jgi:hypothetical protein
MGPVLLVRARHYRELFVKKDRCGKPRMLASNTDAEGLIEVVLDKILASVASDAFEE